ncbi:MAG: hypothetical protein AAF899_01190 [Pseudomonadota bacterium]
MTEHALRLAMTLWPLAPRSGSLQRGLGQGLGLAARAKVSDHAPDDQRAHRPEVVSAMPGPVARTLSGHTHGGHVRPSGSAAAMNQSAENRDTRGYGAAQAPRLVVSGGHGRSILPLRRGMPPEVALTRLASAKAA